MLIDCSGATVQFWSVDPEVSSRELPPGLRESNGARNRSGRYQRHVPVPRQQVFLNVGYMGSAFELPPTNVMWAMMALPRFGLSSAVIAASTS